MKTNYTALLFYGANMAFYNADIIYKELLIFVVSKLSNYPTTYTFKMKCKINMGSI